MNPPQPDAFVPPIDVGPIDTGPVDDAFVVHTDAGTAPMSVAQRARAIATTLRANAHFLVGMGNDLDGAPTYDSNRAGVYTLGTTLDIHYTYLTGYSDMGGWTTWNSPPGEFAGILADACQRHGGLAPMFGYYQLALEYENHHEALHDATRCTSISPTCARSSDDSARTAIRRWCSSSPTSSATCRRCSR